MEGTDHYLQMNWLSMRNSRLKFKTLEKVAIISKESMKYKEKARKITTCNRLDLETHYDLDRSCPKVFPRQCLGRRESL